MWSEWLARTLQRARLPEANAMTRAPAPAQDGELGTDDVRPSTRALLRAAQDEDESSVAAEV
jgi:hypothetical protein